MNKKNAKIQTPVRRKPLQARSQHKIELMFEATLLLLEASDLHSLTTNAIAAKAGVSIGTFYQYFDGKQALLNALVERELGGMSEKIVFSLQDNEATGTEERIRRIVFAVMNIYGGRDRVHRQLIEHATSQSSATRLNTLYSRLMALFMSAAAPGEQRGARELNTAQAFVLVHSVAGVLRSYALSDAPPPIARTEEALVALITGYLGILRK
jgi:AcrR family transcriptional regulator